VIDPKTCFMVKNDSNVDFLRLSIVKNYEDMCQQIFPSGEWELEIQSAKKEEVAPR
jgi:hypothetical protein